MPPNPPPTDWQLDVEPFEEGPPGERRGLAPPSEATSNAPPPATPPRTAGPSPAARPEAPPPVERIVEAMLFVGGPPLTPDAVAGAVRGLTADRVAEIVAGLNAGYRAQRRPYTVEPRGGGWVLAARPNTIAVRERLHGGPKAARLSQPAVDVLGLVAYRQPVGKPALDAARGADAAGPLRQLVRLGLVTLRKDAGGYATTPRFLELFGLTGVGDLPRPAEAA